MKDEGPAGGRRVILDYIALWDRVIAESSLPRWSLHGPRHWRRVEKNGLLLATRTGADTDVVRLFALFHDSRRVNESRDDGHGARGAAYAASLHGNAFDLPDDLFELFSYACTWHTDGRRHDDPTIGSCWDADRLDLSRVCIQPDPRFMCTDYGRELARGGGSAQGGR